MSRHRPLDPLRFVLMNLVIAAVAIGLILGVSALPTGIVWATLAFVAGLVLTPLLASPLEWIVHRYVYHRVIVPFLRPIYDVHHKGHHYVFFPTSRYVTGGPPRRIPVLGDDHFRHVHTAGWKNGLVRLAHFSFYMTIGAVFIWLPAWLLTGSVPFLIGIIVASVIVSDLFITVHDTIHRIAVLVQVPRQSPLHTPRGYRGERQLPPAVGRLDVRHAAADDDRSGARASRNAGGCEGESRGDGGSGAPALRGAPHTARRAAAEGSRPSGPSHRPAASRGRATIRTLSSTRSARPACGIPTPPTSPSIRCSITCATSPAFRP